MSSFDFTKTLKLYYFREKQMVSLSILISPAYVMTFYFNSNLFDKILVDSVTREGAHIKPYYILRKKAFLRFTVDSSDGVQTNLRVDGSKWDQLVREYRDKKENAQEPIETCVVD